MRALVSLGVALALSVAFSVSAKADVVRPELGSGCNRAMSVETWTPAQGAPARWVADRLRDGGCDVVMVLGASAEGSWTVEGTVMDASGYCHADLVLTKKSGWRVSHRLLDANDEVMDVSKEAHQKILARLWRMANDQTWPATSMTRPTKVTLSSYDPDDPSSRYPGYLVRVEDAPRHRLYDYRLDEEHMMCWCFHSWSTRVLRTSP